MDLRELLDFFVPLLDFFVLLLEFLLLLDLLLLLEFVLLEEDFLPFAPPVSLFTVAQPMRSASFSLPPRFLTLSSMCAAIRFCLLL